MSALHDRLQADLNTARKAQDKPLTLVLGTLLSEIKNKRIELRRDLVDDEVVDVVRKAGKRRDGIGRQRTFPSFVMTGASLT